MLGHMPLARHISSVAGTFQCLGDRNGSMAQFAGVGITNLCAPIIDHVANARLMSIQARQQRGSRGNSEPYCRTA